MAVGEACECIQMIKVTSKTVQRGDTVAGIIGGNYDAEFSIHCVSNVQGTTPEMTNVCLSVYEGNWKLLCERPTAEPECISAVGCKLTVYGSDIFSLKKTTIRMYMNSIIINRATFRSQLSAVALNALWGCDPKASYGPRQASDNFRQITAHLNA